MTPDPYEVLQVHPRAELDVIRAAFRTLARKYHPDFGGTGARMVSLNDAWAILGDAKRRKAYDAALKAAAAAADPATTNGHASASPKRAHRATTAAGATAYESAPWTAAGDKASAPTEDLYAPAHAPAAPASSGTGTILDFGRYNGWSLVDLARQDPYYLEWLERTPIGRPMRSEIQELLGQQKATADAAAVAQAPARRRRRWGR